MEGLEEAVGEVSLLMLRGIHPRTEEDRTLSAEQKGEAKGLEETVSQEVEREIMIRGIHPGTKLEDRALLAVEKVACKGLEKAAPQEVDREIMIKDIHLGT